MKREYDSKEYEDNYNNSRTGPRAYHFHTSILAVNRTIHDEAEKLLCERNVFVVVTYKFPELGKAIGGPVWLPIVSNKHVDSMRLHSLRIFVESKPGGLSRTSGQTDLSSQPQSIILLASDLEIFHLIMRASGTRYDTKGLAVMILPDDNGDPFIYGPTINDADNKSAAFTCELRDSKHRPMDHETQHQMLAPMASILCPSQRVCFTGKVCDLEQVEHLAKVMSPSLCCLEAREWSFFQSLSLAKSAADAAAQHDDTRFVVDLYTAVVCTLESLAGMNLVEPGPRRVLFMTYHELAVACSELQLEAMVNMACGMLKMENMDYFANTIYKIRVFFRRRITDPGGPGEITAGLAAYYRHIELWYSLYRGLTPTEETVRDVIGQFATPECSPHQVHDRDVLLRHQNQDEQISSKHLPLDQCSAVQLPLPCTNFHKILKPANRYDGWHDSAFLRSLDQDDKKQIMDQQRRLGIEVTDLDEL